METSAKLPPRKFCRGLIKVIMLYAAMSEQWNDMTINITSDFDIILS